jgi:hypothetical protein
MHSARCLETKRWKQRHRWLSVWREKRLEFRRFCAGYQICGSKVSNSVVFLSLDARRLAGQSESEQVRTSSVSENRPALKLCAAAHGPSALPLCLLGSNKSVYDCPASTKSIRIHRLFRQLQLSKPSMDDIVSRIIGIIIIIHSYRRRRCNCRY